MECNVLKVFSREAVLEILKAGNFESTLEFEVFVNKELKFITKRTVITLFNLEPDTDYSIDIKVKNSKEELFSDLHTKTEAVLLNVKDFGAKGDGVSNDTPFIQAAIMACPKEGRVVVPEGVYKIYPLFLKSNLIFDIKKGATLSAYTDREAFPVMPGNVAANGEINEYFLGTWEGDPAKMFAGILTGIKCKNVLITGEGTIDGCASIENWWHEPKKIVIATRPRMVFLNQCKDITMLGVTIKNSPSWNIHPYFSKDLDFIDLKIISPKVSPNTDGLNPESCKRVNIVGVYFSVGDDCIAIKSGKIYMGSTYKTPSKEISIKKCCMRDGHGAIVIGSEMAGGVKDLLVEDCVFLNTDRGLRIKTRRGRGKDAIVDNVIFNRIKMDNVMTPVVINSFYFCDSDGHSDYVQSKEKMPVDDRTPELGTFTFSNIEATNCHVAASYLYGLPEKKIKSVKFENVSISFAKEKTPGVPAMMDGVSEMTGFGLFAKNIEDLSLVNVSIEGNDGDKIIKD